MNRYIASIQNTLKAQEFTDKYRKRDDDSESAIDTIKLHFSQERVNQKF